MTRRHTLPFCVMREHIRIANAALLALLLAGCATAVPVPPADSIRVMTFNIRLDLASDGDNAWPHRKDAVASMIRFHGADLVGLQEALPEQLRDLDALLPDFSRFGAGRGADRLGEHCAILYRRDRFELLAHDTFWLSETPEVPGSKGWDAAYERIVTWGRLRDRRSDEVFLHVNTHLDNVGSEARREGARLLLRRVDGVAGSDRTGVAIVVTGDFNDTPRSEPWLLMTAGGFDDALDRSLCPHHGPASTWNGFTAIEAGRRIDFVFVRGDVAVLQHAVLSDTFDAHRFPSDHLPVIAELRIGASRHGVRSRCVEAAHGASSVP
ncbi:MAG TPA: endonuclease/exonuclease/phosphatase family protein [Thermoanaerobaculia bacterium]|nr:endonuclease/exonuclease/phosphatase family protein [Thermoanaerobaculia bacterium]